MLINIFFLILSLMFIHSAGQQPSCGISEEKRMSPNCTISTQHIVGGVEAGNNHWPWQLMLSIDGQFLCGAVLIHTNFALTATHCTHDEYLNSDLAKIKIHGGSNNQKELLRIEKNCNLIWSSKIKKETQNYDPVFESDDISILELETPAPYSATIQPVCLPNDNETAKEGEGCYVTGWGAIKEVTNKDIVYTVENLREVCVPIYNDTDCQNYDYIGGSLPDRICAGYVEGGKDSCAGDSGGPLVCKRDGVYKLFGIVNSGHGCADAYYPGIYADVTKYLVRIRETISKLTQHV